MMVSSPSERGLGVEGGKGRVQDGQLSHTALFQLLGWVVESFDKETTEQQRVKKNNLVHFEIFIPAAQET